MTKTPIVEPPVYESPSPSVSKKSSSKLLLFGKQTEHLQPLPITPIRYTNSTKKRITHERRLDSEDKINQLSERGIRDWLADIQDGAFKYMSAKKHRVLREDVDNLTNGKYYSKTRFDVKPNTDDIFEMNKEFFTNAN